MQRLLLISSAAMVLFSTGLDLSRSAKEMLSTLVSEGSVSSSSSLIDGQGSRRVSPFLDLIACLGCGGD
jgi:hypothetical protein